ncbi:MAG: DUF2147 domain-containing protein [Myxococcota bacterium]
MMRYFLILCFSCLLVSSMGLRSAVAYNGKGDQRVFGVWKTIDDKTKKPKSLVRIYKKNGKLKGKIIKLFRKPGQDPNPLCKKCQGKLKNKPIIGMNIVWNMRPENKHTWGKGKILDPKNGKVYGCAMWIDKKNPNRMRVRGYLFVFFRTQTWQRVRTTAKATPKPATPKPATPKPATSK